MLQHKKKKDLKIEIQFRADKNYVMNTHDDKKYAPIESICHSKIIICNRNNYIHFQSVYLPEDYVMATEIIKNIENFVFFAWLFANFLLVCICKKEKDNDKDNAEVDGQHKA